MVAYRRLTGAEKAAVVMAHRCKASVREIAATLGRDQATVRYWIRAGFRESLGKPAKKGRKCSKNRQNPPPKPPRRVLQAQKKRRGLVRRLACEMVTTKHRTRPAHTGARSIRDVLARNHGIVVTSQTIRNDLKALGFKNRARTKSLAFTKADYARRSAFARRWQSKPKGTLIFTDEKTFTCGDYSAGRQWVAPGAEPVPLDRSNTAQDTVYVWGAIGVGFRKLVILRMTSVAEKVRRCVNRDRKPCAFNGSTYIRKCLAGDVVEFCVRHGRILQADNHRVHYSEQVRKYLKSKGVAITEDWPARSPDLNPIENYWAYLQRRVSERVPLTADELCEAIKAEFALTPQSLLDAYTNSFQAKCKRVVSRQGRM